MLRRLAGHPKNVSQKKLGGLTGCRTLLHNKCWPTMFICLAGRPTMPSNKRWPTRFERLAEHPTMLPNKCWPTILERFAGPFWYF